MKTKNQIQKMIDIHKEGTTLTDKKKYFNE